MSQTTLKFPYWKDAPENYTGIIDRTNGVNGSIEYYRDGLLHRIDGPAIKYMAGNEYWYVDGDIYFVSSLNWFIEHSVFLKKEKGKYDLYWLKFLTEKGIEEFPIIPGMEKNKDFIEIIENLNMV